jgi:type IV pilus assembly protein PilM
MKKFNRLYGRKVLSMDIGSFETKIVEGRYTKRGIVVYDYFTVPTPENSYMDGEILDRELIYYTLRQELKNRNIKTKNVYFTINSSSIITREIIIPKVDRKEIEGLLKFQIKEYIPTDSENYIVQFKIIDTIYEEDIEKLNILLIAIPKNIIEEHFQLIKDLDLHPKVLDYQPNSVAKIINYNFFINEIYPIENVTFAAIDLGYSSTKITIIKNDGIMVSRIVAMGTKDVKENILVKQSIQKLNDKIDMVFRYYLSREIDNTIDMILLYGGGSAINGISSTFSDHFNIPSILIKSLNNIKFDGEFNKYINSLGAIIRTTEV